MSMALSVEHKLRMLESRRHISPSSADTTSSTESSSLILQDVDGSWSMLVE